MTQISTQKNQATIGALGVAAMVINNLNDNSNKKQNKELNFPIPHITQHNLQRNFKKIYHSDSFHSILLQLWKREQYV